MASNKEYLDYVLDLLREVDGISFKKMMGEYILYKNNVIIGGIYDNRFLVKPTKSIKKLGLKEGIPFPGAKPMLLMDIENPGELKEIVEKIYKDLK